MIFTKTIPAPRMFDLATDKASQSSKFNCQLITILYFLFQFLSCSFHLLNLVAAKMYESGKVIKSESLTKVMIKTLGIYF